MALSLVVGFVISLALWVALLLLRVAIVGLACVVDVLWQCGRWLALTGWDFSRYLIEQRRERRAQLARGVRDGSGE